VQRGGEASGSAADVEHPLPDQIARSNELVQELAPVFVDRPQAVVGRR
jgi:hypothetical protein